MVITSPPPPPVAVQSITITSLSPGRDGKYRDEHVCIFIWMSIHLHVSKTICPDITEFSAHVTCDHDSVLF